MNRLLITSLACIFCLTLYAEASIEWTITDVDPDIADLIQQDVNRRLSNVQDKQIAIVLKQNDKMLTASFTIQPDDENGSIVSENIWNDYETFGQRLAQAIRSIIGGEEASQQPAVTQQQTYQQPYQQQQTTPQRSSDNKFATTIINIALQNNPVQVPQFTMADVQNRLVAVGGCLTFDDGSRGIVYYVDNQGHGLVVSLNSTMAKWENASKKRDCHDISVLPNEDGTKACTYGMGVHNTAAIINQLGIYNAPAAAWCTSLGEGWYLPSAGELWHLLAVANKPAGAFGSISLMCAAMGGQSFSEKWHWSSTENDNDEAINVSISGSMSSEDKVETLCVRAIRAF